MTISIPFLSNYDPPGSSEGSIDPLGLYQIADQLAVQLVPGVRERMNRIRFLTAMAVGALVVERIPDDVRHRDASPYLVWEWLVVEALVREMGDDPALWGVPGSLVAKRALRSQGCLDARGYLKTPRIFGFHGVYKRLAIHLEILNVHMLPGPNAQGLVDTWARGFRTGLLANTDAMIGRWTTAVERSLKESPPASNPGWKQEHWSELARAFSPRDIGAREKRFLSELLLSSSNQSHSALAALWELQELYGGDDYVEEDLHQRLVRDHPQFAQLVQAISCYEAFARSLDDGFTLLRYEAARADSRGFVVSRMSTDRDFRDSVRTLQDQFASAHAALGAVPLSGQSLQNLFSGRFGGFLDGNEPAEVATLLCAHHERIQKEKSAEGKRPWFDRLSPDRIYLRHNYRPKDREVRPGFYVHSYRGAPIRRFYFDLQ